MNDWRRRSDRCKMQIMLGNEKFIIEIAYNRIKVLTNNVYLHII